MPSPLARWEFEQVLDYSQKRPEDTFLIDVREPDELATSGAIPNSFNIPLGVVGEALRSPARFRKLTGQFSVPSVASTVVFSCMHGVRAEKAARLADSVFDCAKVAVYYGSYADWLSKTGRK
jgi:rhodanese-related sulfurtransferase